MPWELVVKVGGALLRTGALATAGGEIGELARRRRILVVPGGGVFADSVREVYRRGWVSEEAAHWMAILAMDQYGHLLAEGIPGGTPVTDAGAGAAAWERGRVPVLLPHRLLRQADPVPPRWEVTSDSIAAWVALRLGIPRLVLLKTARALGTAEGGRFLRVGAGGEVTAAALGRRGVVDPHLEVVLRGRGLEVWLVDGEAEGALTALVSALPPAAGECDAPSPTPRGPKVSGGRGSGVRSP